MRPRAAVSGRKTVYCVAVSERAPDGGDGRIKADWRDFDSWDGQKFVWEISYACNYRCSYCHFELRDSWDEMSAYQGAPRPEAWKQAWERLYERYGSATILVVGGEPLHHPGAGEILEHVARRHYVSIITNLSLPSERLEELACRLPAQRTRFGATFHPEFAEAGPLRDKLAGLRDKGFDVWLTIVAWPPLLERLPEWREYFAAAGIPLSVCVFFGTHEGKTYPEAYTEAQRAFLDPFLSPFDRRYQLRREDTIGLPCAAGFVYAKVRANGDVYRCGTVAEYRSTGQEPVLGNVFDPAFRLNEAPAPCPMRRCECGESRYLLESYGERHPPARARILQPATPI